MKNLNILMTGAGAPGAPGIIRCYRNNGERDINVMSADMNSKAVGAFLSDRFHVIPGATDPAFISALMEIAVQAQIDVIQPLVTRELNILAENIHLFEQKGIKLCVCPYENLVLANDKGLTLGSLSRAGLCVPDYRVIRNVGQFIAACRELCYPDRPICFKPTKANGSRGFRIMDHKTSRFDLLFNSKPTSTYMSYNEALELFSSAEELPELLVMEYLPGVEYSIDVLADHGSVIVAIPRKRIAMNGGISTRCITEKNMDVIEYCNNVVHMLQLHGNIGIQVKYSVDNKVKILEINPRVQGSIVNCAAAGVNLPYLAIKQAMNEPLPPLHVRWGVEMMRYWNEVFYDDQGSAFTY
jgi:carbamoyl-phosphate synthase large subunit